MAKVDWNDVLPPGVEVVFSALELPDERDAIDDDLVQLRFDGLLLDVEWIDRDGVYCVTLLEDGGDFDDPVEQVDCRSAREVVDQVKAIVEAHRGPVTSRSGSGDSA